MVEEGNQDMSKIKKHQCPSCGSHLTVNNDKQIYYCTFCGSTFDYEYFREEQMHELGETCLSRGEFMSAVDAFKFILNKDPHDFFALRGLMLAAANLKNIDELDRINQTKSFSYDSDMVKEAVEAASEEDKEYFKEFARVYSEKTILADDMREIKSLEKEKSKIITEAKATNLDSGDFYYYSKYGTKQSPLFIFVLFWVLTSMWLYFAIMCIVGLCDSIASGDDNQGLFIGFAIFFGIFAVGSAAYNMFGVFPRLRKLNLYNAYNKSLYAETNMLDERIKYLEGETEKTSDDIKRSIHEFVRKDKQIVRDKRSS